MPCLAGTPVAPHWGPREAKSSGSLRTFVLLNKKSTMYEDNDEESVTLYASYKSILTHTPLQWHLLSRAPSTERHVAVCRSSRRRRASSSVDTSWEGFTAWQLVLEFLNANELQSCSLVSKDLYDVAKGSHFWHAIYRRSWRVGGLNLPRQYYLLSYQRLIKLIQIRQHLSPPSLSTRGGILNLPNGLVQVTNNSVMRSFARGSIESIAGREALLPTSCACALGLDLTYFEVALQGAASIGMVSLKNQAFGFGKEYHVGWQGFSIGHHGDSGVLLYHDGKTSPQGGVQVAQGPRWGYDITRVDVVGCGHIPITNSIFYTLNGRCILSYKLPNTIPAPLALAVSLDTFGDTCVINTGIVPFAFDIEDFCLSLLV